MIPGMNYLNRLGKRQSKRPIDGNVDLVVFVNRTKQVGINDGR